MKWFWVAFVAYCFVSLVTGRGKTYGGKLLLFVDEFFCAVFWRDTGITISSMVGLEVKRTDCPRWAKWLHAALNGIEANHCENAIQDDILRAQAAILILTGKDQP